MDNSFYYNMYLRYKAADSETQKAGLEHWQQVHKENIATGRFDLYIFSGSMVNVIQLAMNGQKYTE